MLQFTAPGGLFAPEPPLRQSVVVPVGLSTAGFVVDEIAPARAIGTITSAATARVVRPAIRRRRPCRPFFKALPPCTAPAPRWQGPRAGGSRRMRWQLHSFKPSANGNKGLWP